MKIFIFLVVAALLNSCAKEDGNKYQLVVQESGIFRLDVKSGEIVVCGFSDTQQRIVCASSPSLINPQSTAEKPKPGIYDAYPLAPNQPK